VLNRIARELSAAHRSVGHHQCRNSGHRPFVVGSVLHENPDRLGRVSCVQYGSISPTHTNKSTDIPVTGSRMHEATLQATVKAARCLRARSPPMGAVVRIIRQSDWQATWRVVSLIPESPGIRNSAAGRSVSRTRTLRLKSGVLGPWEDCVSPAPTPIRNRQGQVVLTDQIVEHHGHLEVRTRKVHDERSTPRLEASRLGGRSIY